jgi:hypothetical protein
MFHLNVACVFHLDVAEVDRDVAHIAMVIHILQVYVLNVSTIFRYMLQVHVLKCFSVLDICCKCFIWMLHILQWLYTYVSNVCFKCFSCFRSYL